MSFMQPLESNQQNINNKNTTELDFSPTKINNVQQKLVQNYQQTNEQNNKIRKQKLKRIRNIIMTILYISVFLTLFLLVTLWSPASTLIYDIMNDILKLKAWGYILIIFLGIFILISGIPISFFLVFIGFPLKEFYLPFIFMVCVIIGGGTIQFCLVKYIFRKRFIKAFENSKYFKVIQILLEGQQLKVYQEEQKKENEKQQNQNNVVNENSMENEIQKKKNKKKRIFKEFGDLKHLFLINCLAFPQFVLNYGIPLFQVKYWQFIITGLPYQLFYGSMMIYIGQTASDLNQILDGDNPVKTYLFVGTCILSLLIISYLYWFTRKTLKQQNKLTTNKQSDMPPQPQDQNQNLETSQEQQANNDEDDEQQQNVLHIDDFEQQNQNNNVVSLQEGLLKQ